MKRITQAGVFILACVFCLSAIPFSGATIQFAEESKLTDKLIAEFEKQSDDITAAIWLSDIDLSSTEAEATEATNQLVNLLTETSEENSNGELRTNTICEIDIVQQYIEAKRNAASKLYTSYNQKMAASFFTKRILCM